MKRFGATIVLLLAFGLAGCQTTPYAGSQGTQAQPTVWDVRFSPRGGATQLVVDTLAQAKSAVLVQAYSFTSEPIAQALVSAHQRGVRVEVILDKSQRTENDSMATLVANAGISVFIDAAHAIAHNKVMVIDDAIVITGSFNFTKSAEERNAENLLMLHDRALAVKYTTNWQQHRAHSQPY